MILRPQFYHAFQENTIKHNYPTFAANPISGRVVMASQQKGATLGSPFLKVRFNSSTDLSRRLR